MDDHASLTPDSILRQFLEATHEGFWYIDNDTCTIDLNPAMCRLLGRAREEVISRPIFDFVDDENAQIFHDQIEARSRGVAGPYEIALRRPDDTNIPCINNATPVYNDNGQKVASIGLWTDISEQKAVQHELSEAKLQAEQASEAKSEFLSSMSHELRTPLQAIVGFADLMATDADYSLNGVQHDRLKRIRSNSRHLIGLVDAVLDLSKLDAGAVSLPSEAVPIRETVDECLSLIDAAAAKRNLTIRDLTAGLALPDVRADPTSLKQILVNILSNAVKYNRPGGEVSIDCKVVEASELTFIIADTGPGIPPEDMERLFDPFERLGYESGQIEGIGIGLTIVKRLIESIDGRISVHSDAGSGTVFEATLPLASGTSAQSSERASKDDDNPVGVPPGLILYIEDNPDLRDLMKSIVARHGNLRLASAHNAETGLALAKKEPPDVILLDINLPDMNGIEARRKLRESPTTAAVPVIAVTGATANSEIIAREFTSILQKPFLISKVLSEISVALALRNANP